MRPIFALTVCLLLAPAALASRQRAVRHPAAAPPPAVSHVFVVILENTDAAAALEQPFIGRLISEGTWLRNYYALMHPSQPNYIALTAGSLYGVNNDNPITLKVQHLGDLLENRGLSWKAYAEDYPGNCSLVVESGEYVRRHVPFLSYDNIQKNRARCNAHIVNASELDADIAAGTLPSFSLFVPNNRNNGHDTSVAFADQWLENRFGSLLQDARFTRDLLFVLTFDEGTKNGDNRVATVLWGRAVKAGAISDFYFDHYSLLHTIEKIFGTGSLGQHDQNASTMMDLIAH